VSLRGLIPTASFVGCADITVSAVTEHSHEICPGSLFAALPGTRSHGRDFVKHALQGGAAAILTDRPLADVPLPQCIVPDVRQVYGRLCHGLYAFPSRQLGVAGVTGTNGKTTTTWIVRSLLESASHPTGVIGTIEYNDGIESRPSTLTTPDALTLAQVMAAMKDRQTTHAAIELSSHALKQDRAAGVSLDVGMVTNVTQDHFDYHKTFHDYVSAKARISTLIKRGGVLVLNADDAGTDQILERLDCDVRVVTFGIDSAADIQAERLTLTPQGTRFQLVIGQQRMECMTPLVGQHNVSNCLAAVAAAAHFGLSPEQIVQGLAQFEHVPGRLERVDLGQDFQVFVDFAHTADALQRVIHALRAITAGRIILCCGAGGDRDREKRPRMGQAAALADSVILTSDNPRSEDPRQILADLMAGFPQQAAQPELVIDRRQAIATALQQARPGDVVLIAGKGHEQTQILKEKTIPFDDVSICRELLREQGHRQLPRPHFSPAWRTVPSSETPPF
jgi:UDP-N-acetylmuramoyl-L-alanyl-D-glutamate--2,6-diaminopimelate ligase